MNFLKDHNKMVMHGPNRNGKISRIHKFCSNFAVQMESYRPVEQLKLLGIIWLKAMKYRALAKWNKVCANSSWRKNFMEIAWTSRSKCGWELDGDLRQVVAVQKRLLAVHWQDKHHANAQIWSAELEKSCSKNTNVMVDRAGDTVSKFKQVQTKFAVIKYSFKCV